MPKYAIEQYEIHAQTYQVDADSEADAIRKLWAGEASMIDNEQDYIEIANDVGLPVDEFGELADALRAIGESVGEDIIPSIRCVKEVTC